MPLIPAANNTLSSLDLFLQRKIYKDQVFPKWGARPLDMWYEKPYYGKVDIYGNPVYPSEAYYKKIKSTNIFALNFVVDAFEDLKLYLSKALNAGRINKDDFRSMLHTFKPITAAANVHTLYHSHFSDVIYNAYVNVYIDTFARGKIQNFADFAYYFVQFAKDARNEVPITKTSFITSGICPNNISGLTIEMRSLKNDEDYAKYQLFLDNDFFSEYREAANSFGFYIDKNAPWRLVANLASDRMKQYMSRYGITIADNGLFDTYFYRSRTYDYLGFRNYLYESYNSFISSHPTIVSYKTLGCTGRPFYKTIQTMSPREVPPSEFEDFIKKYDDKFFLDIYFKVRIAESKQKLTKLDYNIEYKKVINLLSYISLNAAINHIDSFTKQTRIYEKPRPLDSTPFQITYLSEKQLSGLSFRAEPDILTSMGETQRAYGSFVSY